MKQDFKTAVALLKAADLIETKGWCRGDFRQTSENGERFCALGALRQVNGFYDKTPHWNWDTYTHANRELEAQIEADYAIPAYEVDVAAWNDDQRDRRKVIRLFRRTAKRLLSHV